jgi:four helix bundle protein
MRICLKELRETEVWLQLVERHGLLKNHDLLDQAAKETGELIAIFTKSVLTASRNGKAPTE